MFDSQKVEQAKSLCAHCSVKDDCRLAGVAEDFGVWAGVARDGVAAVLAAEGFHDEWHSTYYGYSKGCRKRCCKAAKAAYIRQYRHAKKVAATV